MIAIAVMDLTAPAAPGPPRRTLLLGLAAGLAGCVARSAPPGPPVRKVGMDADAFIMRDGARLPYRTWLPEGVPHTVMLALHGFNDSRDAFEIPAPNFQAAGVAIYAPDHAASAPPLAAAYGPAPTPSPTTPPSSPASCAPVTPTRGSC